MTRRRARGSEIGFCNGVALRMAAEHYDMAGLKGHDARIPTGQFPADNMPCLQVTTWMAGNETRTDTHGRCRKKKRASKPEDRLTPSRGVGCTASPPAKHIPARMNLRGRGEHTCYRSAKAGQICFILSADLPWDGYATLTKTRPVIGRAVRHIPAAMNDYSAPLTETDSRQSVFRTLVQCGVQKKEKTELTHCITSCGIGWICVLVCRPGRETLHARAPPTPAV